MRRLNTDQRRTLRRLVLPGALTEMSVMRRFGREHALDLRGVKDYKRFRYAQKFGIDLLPAGALTGRVLDIGANEGQFLGALLGIAPGVTVTAFEPEPTTAARLRANFGSDPRVTIAEIALGEQAGTAALHVTENTVFASLNEPLASLPDMYARGAETARTVDVDVRRLDQVVDGPIALLKLDVQGAEQRVLAGGRRVLAETRTVLVELNFVQHYADEASFGDLHQLLVDAGLHLHAIGPPQRSSTDARLLWADACYTRFEA